MNRRGSFQRGFLAGFASPFTLIQPPPRGPSPGEPADLVAAAWQDVGQALRSAMGIIEEQAHGEDAQETA